MEFYAKDENGAHVGTPMGYMRYMKLDSSVIKACGYFDDFELLIVEFTSGKRYCYHRVSKADFLGLINADSAGKYFNEEIKPCYPFTREAVAA